MILNHTDGQMFSDIVNVPSKVKNQRISLITVLNIRCFGITGFLNELFSIILSNHLIN